MCVLDLVLSRRHSHWFAAGWLDKWRRKNWHFMSIFFFSFSVNVKLCEKLFFSGVLSSFIFRLLRVCVFLYIFLLKCAIHMQTIIILRVSRNSLFFRLYAKKKESHGNSSTEWERMRKRERNFIEFFFARNDKWACL